jgi:hypothetical protein
VSIIEKLQEWCERQGRDMWKLVRGQERTLLTHFPAPNPARENAIRRESICSWGKWNFGLAMSATDWGPRIGERVEQSRLLRENISKARGAPSPPST